MAALADSDLDAILAVQFTVSWAGEGRCEPKRLAWWDTDLIDPAGGGDLLARLLPQTHAWSALEATRAAAERTEAKARSKMAQPDQMRTLFFLGFEIDEQLSDRLALLKRSSRTPADALPLKLALGAAFSRDALAATWQQDNVTYDVVPGGRQLKGAPPKSAVQLVTQLVAALLPLAAAYPLPFYKLGG